MKPPKIPLRVTTVLGKFTSSWTTDLLRKKIMFKCMALDLQVSRAAGRFFVLVRPLRMLHSRLVHDGALLL